MANGNWLMVIAVAAVALSILYLAKVLSVKSSERAGEQGLALSSTTGQPAVTEVGLIPTRVSPMTPIALPNSSGRLVTAGSVADPPEPGGYIADSEITEVTPPTMFRQFLNTSNMYMHTTFGPGSQGDILYPWKTGHYVRSGVW